VRWGRICNVSPTFSSLGPPGCDDGDSLINLVVRGEALRSGQFSGVTGSRCSSVRDPLARRRRLQESVRSPDARLACSRTFHSHIKTGLPLVLGCGNIDSECRSLRSS
jgi:hypothetical protein